MVKWFLKLRPGAAQAAPLNAPACRWRSCVLNSSYGKYIQALQAMAAVNAVAIAPSHHAGLWLCPGTMLEAKYAHMPNASDLSRLNVMKEIRPMISVTA